MALLGNYSVLNRTPGRFTSGTVLAQNRCNFGTSGAIRNFYSHAGLFASLPDGYSAPYSWSMAQAIGAMSSFTDAGGVITPLGNLAGGYNLTGSASSVLIYTNAQLDQIVSLICSALLSATSTNANLSASVNAQASSVMSMVTSANIGAIVSILASSNSAITINAIISALAHMNAEAGGPPVLSPEGLANAVWSKDISEFMDTNTSGRKLNDSGSATNPWSAPLSSNNTTGTFGWLVQKLLTVGKFLGLK